ncbi:MAG: M15 family metallopeptidase [Acidimicrobiia bacterium]|nr:M15 family metallopeptidase [Acidimicrobiia bacterium]
MTEIVPASPRLQAIRARVSQIEQTAGAPSTGGSRLGFGLALQNAVIDAGQPASPAAGTAGSLGGGGGPLVAASVLVDDGAHHPHGVELHPAHADGTRGPLDPPPELVGFGNGRVPVEALAPVGDTGHRLYAPAAEALTVLLHDAQAAGVTIGLTDSYRSLAGQHDVAERKGIYGQGGLAAVPGTSNHGWGLSTDLALDGPALSWMREHAWRYGFVEDVPREPWHWTYRPA